MSSSTIKRLFISLSLIAIFSNGFTQMGLSLTYQMLSAVKSIKSLSYNVESKERVDGKLQEEKMLFKINVNPLKTYVYQFSPHNGLEALYIAGENEDRVKINPAGFPWVLLNLEPEGYMMLENRHHSIFDAGFNYTTAIIEHLLQKYGDKSDNLIIVNNDVQIHGCTCYHLTLTNSNYRMIRYTTLKKETPLSLAKKLHINFYSILENNADIKVNTLINPNTTLFIPNDYASRMELFINKSNLMPLRLQIFDHKGLFEEFSFSDIQINPDLKNFDFFGKVYTSRF